MHPHRNARARRRRFLMAGAKLERTRWPGIYRRGDRWAYEWTDAHGKRRRGTRRHARAGVRAQGRARRPRRRGASSGRRGHGPASRSPAYALDLFGADLDREHGATPARGRYQGRKGAIRDSDARRLPPRTSSGTGCPRSARGRSRSSPRRDLARAVADARRARRRRLPRRPRRIRRMFAPLAALLATAVEEGVIPLQPRARRAAAVRPRRAAPLRRGRPDDGDDPAPGKARALTREQLAAFLLVVDPRWRLLFELLAATGLRISEALALRWRDLRLDGRPPGREGAQGVRARRLRAAEEPSMAAGTSRSPFELVRALRERRAAS